MDRRSFLRNTVAALGAAAAASCTGAEKSGSQQQAGGGMTYRTNPTTKDKVSLLGYGMMRLPLKEVEDESGQKVSVIDQDQVNRLVDRALEGGVNFFDTAPMYHSGESETALGIALKRHPRDKYFISTKMSNMRKGKRSREESIKMYRESFRKLQVDYIDYYLMHSIGGGLGLDEFKERFIDNGMLDFLVAERDAGRIRNLGFSFHGDIKVFNYMMEAHEKYHWDFALIQMNYVDWQNAKKIYARNTDASILYDSLEKRGIPNLVMEPLLGGRLANLPEHMNAQLQKRNPERSIASWAFRFVGSKSNVLSILSGMTYMEHLEDNLKTFSPLEKLSAEDEALLLDMAKKFADFQMVNCNYCNYCVPCPYGIAIPEIFRHYNKCVSEGLVPSGKEDPDFRRLRRRHLASYARMVMPERAADKCIGCGDCAPKCPQHVNIPREIRKIDNYIEKLRRETLQTTSR